ncbi:Na+/H+ antiporter subunit D [Peribacillus cavernae]|uniref:Na+/H+ antiporter subunit D n=1 Tax=Peribacillus cavernae TaxID=1674310 RepID=A0A3S0UA31_9BACI|nr:Na+/H+ antiporter subunit D [Peribacillus cavernae]MDQ0219631.1 multicomponent Na+:H+ antiporter subunit D [Peribacillus cavernae]RUQ25917.1 Na+/H+ antiporter subunit D [Peribacillus cavernae]
MNNIVFLPVLLPLLTGIVLLFFSKSIKFQRVFSVLSVLAGILLAVMLVGKVHGQGILTLQVGSWEAPFGIVIVADMLASLLVLTTNLIGFAIIVYSFYSIGKERERFYYYAIFQFLLVGVNGAFLTGDIFNLFVFFEVMLMASYVLLALGGTKPQLRESLKYILVNVISSALFVITVAYLYSVVGTLNMADISRKIAKIDQPGIVTVIAVSFLIVFGLKGAIFPLFFWLPGSYYAPPIPIIALFGALLTKVGIYSILRTYTLLFYHDQGYTHQLLGILALLTIIVGVIGAVGYWDMKKIIIYNIVIAIGVIIFGISLMNQQSLSGSIFYIIHDMIIKAALFLLIGIIIKITGTNNLREISGLIKAYPYVGWTFFIAAISLVGIPPFSGFAGKLLILQGAVKAGSYIGMAVILLSSLMVLYSLMKIFINGFWGIPRAYPDADRVPVKMLLLPAVLLVGVSIVYGFGTEAMYPFISQATEPLIDPGIYINAVLKE